MNFNSQSYLHLLWESTRCEWRMRDQATTLGFLWTLLQPLLMFAVLYAVFTRWMPGPRTHYASLLLVGIVQYGFFSSATTYGLSSLLRRRAILLNFPVPRETMVLAAVFSAMISYLFEFGLMMVFLVALGARPSPAWAALPFLIVIFVGFVVGISLIMAPLAARHPDFERIWSILLSAGFFLTPVFYPLASMDGARLRLLSLNPLTPLIEIARSCLLEGRWPAGRGLPALTLGTAVLIVAGYRWFKANELAISDYLL